MRFHAFIMGRPTESWYIGESERSKNKASESSKDDLEEIDLKELTEKRRARCSDIVQGYAGKTTGLRQSLLGCLNLRASSSMNTFLER